MSKILIINADDLGLTLSRNQAILEGYNKGVISSASAIVNGEYFNDAIEIIGKCPNLGVGIHLNIVEGKALINNRLLCDRNGVFNNGFLAIMLKSRNKAFLEAVENEFRAQIELGTRYISFDHIDSHVHTHAITPIFKIAVKLANEYRIPFIRTQYEKPYLTPRVNKLFTIKYPINLIKVILLNLFTRINAKNIIAPLKTNNNIIGVGYTGMMNGETIGYGIKAAKEGIIEIIIHPEPESEESRIVLRDKTAITNYAYLSDRDER